MSDEPKDRTDPSAGSTSSLLRGLVKPTPRSATGMPAKGDLIMGKYVVEALLGRGGMGLVVSARHMQLGQRVAIKILRGEAATDAQACARFLREGRAAAAVTSEHIAKVFDVGTLESGEPYLVMEFLSGRDLAHVLKDTGPMPIEQAVGAIVQAASGVAEAHARGIVHRDLKPSNLFLAERLDGTPLVKVLDFGISKLSAWTEPEDEEALTPSGVVMGSTPYMSPEQLRSSKNVDRRTDLWSLGVILYELLSGMRPFAGGSQGGTITKILTASPAPLRDHRPEVPIGLEMVILECLDKNVATRLQSVGALAEKLLPFAPRDLSVLVDRIVRAERTSRPAPVATEPMPAEMVGPATSESPFVETVAPKARKSSVAVAAVMIAVAAILAVAAFVVTRGPVRAAASAAPVAPIPPVAQPVQQPEIEQQLPAPETASAAPVPSQIPPPRAEPRPRPTKSTPAHGKHHDDIL